MLSSVAAGVGAVQRVVLHLTIFATPVVLYPRLIDPVMLPKATVVVAGALVVAVLAVAQSLLSGQPRTVRCRPLWVVAALILTMTVITVIAPDTATSLLGQHTRYGGLVEYLAYGVLLVAVAVIYRGRSLVTLTWTLLGALAVVMAYGAVQIRGRDPLAWQVAGGLESYFSTMGNANFASGFVGILVPLALATVLNHRIPVIGRVAAALLIPAAAVYLIALGAAQGPVVASCGSALVLLVAAIPPLARTPVWARWAIITMGAVVLGAAGLVASRRVSAGLRDDLEARTSLWVAGWRIFLDHQRTGVGLDGYGDHFLASRPLSRVVEQPNSFADAAHNVPVGMFAHGGAVLGAVYVLFVLTVAALLVTGLRRMRGSHRIALAGYGGAWFAYQLQSAVSIDVPPLALLHFVTAGVIVARATPPRLRPLPVPALPAVLRVAAAAAVVLLAVPALLLITRPISADAAARSSVETARDGDPDAALNQARRAVEQMPAEAFYERVLAWRLADTGDQAGSLAAYERAARLEPGSVEYARDALEQALTVGDAATVLLWQDELARRDPSNRRVVLGVAEFHRSQGRVERARELYEQLREDYPDDPDIERLLAETTPPPPSPS